MWDIGGKFKEFLMTKAAPLTWWYECRKCAIPLPDHLAQSVNPTLIHNYQLPELTNSCLRFNYSLFCQNRAHHFGHGSYSYYWGAKHCIETIGEVTVLQSSHYSCSLNPLHTHTSLPSGLPQTPPRQSCKSLDLTQALWFPVDHGHLPLHITEIYDCPLSIRRSFFRNNVCIIDTLNCHIKEVKNRLDKIYQN